MINKKLEDNVYEILREFVNTINDRNIKKLGQVFSVSESVAKEIVESLNGFLGSGFSTQISPREKSSETSSGGRPNLEIFEMNKPATWGIECAIWSDGKPQEPILHAEMYGEIDDLRFTYKYIGS